MCVRKWNSQHNSCQTLGRSVANILFVRATPTSSQVTLQLVMQLEREDANTSYLTSSRQSQPSPPSLFLPEVEQATAADSVVVSSSHKAMLSPSTTPWNTAPTAAALTKTQLAWLIISVAGKLWQTTTGGKKKKNYKVAVRDTPA